MNQDLDPRAALDERIEAIETGYEFMLAYAAQGRDTDKGAAAGRSVREFLERMDEALAGLGAIVTACAERADAQLTAVAQPFLAVVETDARIARAAILLVLSRPDISSQLVDNLNASIHLRALLTDLFIIDEALKRRPAGGG